MDNKSRSKHHDRANNEVTNLEWISPSDNRKDRLPYRKQPIEYIDITDLNFDLIVELNEYQGIKYNRYFFDYNTKGLIMESYNRLHYVPISGQMTKNCTLYDVDGKRHTIGWKTFLEEMMRLKKE